MHSSSGKIQGKTSNVPMSQSKLQFCLVDSLEAACLGVRAGSFYRSIFVHLDNEGFVLPHHPPKWLQQQNPVGFNIPQHSQAFYFHDVSKPLEFQVLLCAHAKIHGQCLTKNL
jgi:hypothetical protein